MAPCFLLSRTPIMGLPLSAKAGAQGEEENGQIVLVVSGRAFVRLFG